MSVKYSSYLNYMTVVAGFSVLTGCSTINRTFDNKESVSYRAAKTVSSLEVPPDLTNPQYDSTFEVNSGKVSASASANASVGNAVNIGVPNVTRVNVLPDSATVQIKGSSGDRHLVVATPAGALWSKVQGFWTSVGTGLKRNEPAVGVMETDWIQTRGNLPQGGIQKVLGSILKNGTDSGIRDRYTVRFEKLSANSTAVFMTHRGAELVVTDTGNKWEMRPRRIAAEAEMLNRLKAYLQGADPSNVSNVSVEQKADATPGLVVADVTHNEQSLSVSGGYDDTWARTGVALANIGFAVDGQDKNKGVYAVKWVGYSKEGKSIGSQLKQMFSFKKELLAEGAQQLIQISRSTGSSNTSTLRVLDRNGQPASISTSKKILDRLRTELPNVTSGSQPISGNITSTSINERTGRNIDSDDYAIGKRIDNKPSKSRQKKRAIDRSYETERTGRNIDSDDYGVDSRLAKSVPKSKQVRRDVDRSYETKRTGRNIDSDDYGFGKKGSANKAKRVVDTNGGPSLTISDSFDNAWARTGLSLTKIGFKVDGQDKAKGLYAVQWVGYSKDGKSLSEQLQQMISFKKEILEEGTEQLIRVNKVNEGAVLQVFDKDGRPAQPDRAKQILERLRKDLNR